MEKLLIDNHLEWKYFAQGGAHVILEYQGHDIEWMGKVMRLCKKHNDTKPHSISENHQFLRDFVSKILGKEYLASSKLHPISSLFLSELALTLPASALIDTSQKHAEIMDNLLRIPKAIDDSFHIEIYTIEIKSKWGFFPRRYATEGLAKCRYCMHQYHKYHNGKISQISNFCPLDIFSSSYDLVSVALDNLFEHPQNNLLLYRSGERLDPASFKDTYGKDGENEGIYGVLRDAIVQCILDSKLFELIKCHQRVLDETSHSICFSGIVHSLKESEYVLLDDLESRKEVFEKYVRLYDELDGNLDGLEIDEKTAIIFYLFSMSLKDLSVIFRFKVDINTNTVVKSNDDTCRLKVVDVDFKSARKLLHYHKQEQEIIHRYRQLNDTDKNTKSCLAN